MTEETPKVPQEETPAETPNEEAPTPPSEETPKEEPKPEEKPKEEAPQDVDYKKELEDLPKPPEAQPKRTEEERADFTIQSIFKRHPNLRDRYQGEVSSEGETNIDDLKQEIRGDMLRTQVETQIRANSKSEDEVKYKMYFFDHRIIKTGNVHEDADNAEWLANKNRTRNAIKEQQRKPPAPNAPSGHGAKPSSTEVPDLPPEQVEHLKKLGMKKTAKGWEGEHTKLEYNHGVQKWEQFTKDKKGKWVS